MDPIPSISLAASVIQICDFLGKSFDWVQKRKISKKLTEHTLFVETFISALQQSLAEASEKDIFDPANKQILKGISRLKQKKLQQLFKNKDTINFPQDFQACNQDILQNFVCNFLKESQLQDITPKDIQAFLAIFNQNYKKEFQKCLKDDEIFKIALFEALELQQEELKLIHKILQEVDKKLDIISDHTALLPDMSAQLNTIEQNTSNLLTTQPRQQITYNVYPSIPASRFQDSTLDATIQNIKSLINNKKIDIAFPLINQLLNTLDPNSSDNDEVFRTLYNLKGICLYDKLEIEDAKFYFRQAIEKTSGDPIRSNSFQCNLCKVYLYTDNYSECKKLLENMDPVLKGTQEIRFELLMLEQKFEEANKLLEVDTNIWEDSYYYLKARVRLGLKDLNVALDSIEKYISLHPDEFLACMEHGLILSACYLYEDGRMNLPTQLGFNYLDHIQIRIDTSFHAVETLQYIEKIRNLFESLSHKPENQLPLYERLFCQNQNHLSLAYLVLGNYSQALESCMTVYKQYPTEETNLNNLAFVSALMGNTDDAKKYFDELVSHNLHIQNQYCYILILFKYKEYETILKLLDDPLEKLEITDLIFKVSALQQLGQVKNALELAQQYFALKQDFPSKYLLARTLEHTRCNDDAKKHYVELINEVSLEKYNSLEFYQMGCFFHNIDDKEHALTCFEKSWHLEKSKDNIMAGVYLAALYQDDSPKFLTTVEELKKVDSENKDTKRLYGWLLFKLANYQEIIKLYQANYFEDIEKRHYKQFVGQSFLSSGNYKDGLTFADALKTDFPEDYYVLKSVCLYELKEYSTVQQLLIEGFEQFSENRRFLEHFWRIGLKIGLSNSSSQISDEFNAKYQRVLEKLTSGYLDNPILWKVTYDNKDSDSLIQSLTETLQKHSTNVKNKQLYYNQLDSLYEKDPYHDPLSLTALCHFSLMNPIEYLLERINNPFKNVYVYDLGISARKYSENILNILKDCATKPKLLIDFVTLTILHKIEVDNIFVKHFDLYITSATQNIIKDFLNTNLGTSEGKLCLGENDQLIYLPQDQLDPSLDQLKDFLSTFINKLNSDNIIAIKPNDDSTDFMQEMTSVIGNELVHQVQEGIISKQQDMLLCCDDMYLTHFYQEKGLKVIPTYLILEYLFYENSILIEKYAETYLKLIEYKCKYIPITTRMLAYFAFEKRNLNVFQQIVDQLNSNVFTLESIVHLIHQFIIELSTSQTTQIYVGTILEKIIHKLVNIQPNGNLVFLVLGSFIPTFTTLNLEFTRALQETTSKVLAYIPNKRDELYYNFLCKVIDYTYITKENNEANNLIQKLIFNIPHENTKNRVRIYAEDTYGFWSALSSSFR